MKTMTPSERFMRCLNFESVDRIPVMDFGYWRETIDAWHAQGLPAEVDSTEEVERYFGCDRGFETNLVNYWGDSCPVGIQWGIWPPWRKTVIAETETSITYGGEIGIITERKHGESIPFQEKYPVETAEDFRRKVIPRMDARDRSRIGPEFPAMLARGREERQAVGAWIDGYFAWPRELLGAENLLMAYYDDPELIHMIQRHHTEFVKEWIDMVWEITPLDYVCFFEDMAYNHGCFISPKTFDEFLMPYYHELIAHLRAKGVKKFLVDSDGNSVQLTDKLVEAGADGHYPLEINSGSLPEVIRARHPKLALIGGINKLALAEDRAAIDKELSKLPPILEKGGFIPALDHRVQPDVPMANYQYYIDKKREILEKYCY